MQSKKLKSLVDYFTIIQKSYTSAYSKQSRKIKSIKNGKHKSDGYVNCDKRVNCLITLNKLVLSVYFQFWEKICWPNLQ